MRVRVCDAGRTCSVRIYTYVEEKKNKLRKRVGPSAAVSAYTSTYTRV